MSNLKTDKVLFFTAGNIPTAAEISAIARLQVSYTNVLVRNGASAADAKFGANLESCDLCAGTIPADYSGKTVLAVPSSANPDDFKVYPATLTIDASDVDVETPAAVKAEIDPATGLAKLTNMTGDPTCTWASSDATKATVSASTGKITAVAAGTTNITATLQAAPKTAITADSVTDLFTKVAHGFKTGDKVRVVAFTSIVGVSVASDYYIIRVDADTFYLASSYANAVAGTKIDITTSGTAGSIGYSPLTAVLALTVQA